MYRYDNYDFALVRERVTQFRDQLARWQAGELSDEEFRPLRLQNGLYVQRHFDESAKTSMDLLEPFKRLRGRRFGR